MVEALPVSHNAEKPRQRATPVPDNSAEANVDPADAGKLAFKEYPSIETPTNVDAMTEITVERFDQIEWIATEKVHGANFSFVTDGKDIACCSRSNLLDPAKARNFFNYTVVLEEHKERVIKIFNYVKEMMEEKKKKSHTCSTVSSSSSSNSSSAAAAAVPVGRRVHGSLMPEEDEEVHTVTIFGELFGGSYPHKDVPANKEVPRVQHGIWYSPNLGFYGYDISINRHGFLFYDEVCAIFQKFGVLYAKPVARGTFDEMLKFDVEAFETRIPKELGLPPIPDNFAEGVVIRSVRCHKMIKVKRSAFSEQTRGKRRHGALPAQIQARIGIAKSFITLNRLRAVLSKGFLASLPADTDFALSSVKKQLASLLANDACKDFEKEQGIKYEEPTPEQVEAEKQQMKKPEKKKKGKKGSEGADESKEEEEPAVQETVADIHKLMLKVMSHFAYAIVAENWKAIISNSL